MTPINKENLISAGWDQIQGCFGFTIPMHPLLASVEHLAPPPSLTLVAVSLRPPGDEWSISVGVRGKCVVLVSQVFKSMEQLASLVSLLTPNESSAEGE